MRILIIDNYDSFTYNLFQQVANIRKCVPDVFKNDEISYNDIVANEYDCIIISPGPGHPDVKDDFGVCAEVIARFNKPLLGVCLGHQGIAHFAGGVVTYAPEPYHGRLTPIFHNGSGLFKDMPQGFNVVRYHSLVISTPLPKDIEKTAWTEDGIIMAIAHKTKPYWGIQFHPESISTEFGNEVMERFLDLADGFNKGNTPLVKPEHKFPPRGGVRLHVEQQGGVSAQKNDQKPHPTRAPGRESLLPTDLKYISDTDNLNSKPSGKNVEKKCLLVEHQVCDLNAPADAIFYNLFGQSKYSFWLDTNKMIQGDTRFSIMGSPGGTHERTLLFDRNNKELKIITDGKATIYQRDLFEYLEEELDKYDAAPSNQFPFNFNGGFIGYFGYELKSELNFKTSHQSEVPDAALIFSTRFLVIDHKEDKIYIVALIDDSEETTEARHWITTISEKLKNLKPVPVSPEINIGERLRFYGSQNHNTYIENIKKCLTEIKNGESYEICLTNRLSVDLALNPLDLYLNLRRINPAPYSAYLHFDGFSILSSSPEQFLKMDNAKNVSTMPIKGTIARDDDQLVDANNKAALQKLEKFRAENLMIVDLLRNDFGKVCEIGSVRVPKLMAVEAYETLNHLVSTVTGKLRSEFNIIDLFKATFPGGSITGAPKRRTMEIIDRLEPDARGPYTGALGYLSLCGAAELSIVIRTAVVQKDKITVGTGGAVISLSDPQEEFDEILLKAFPLIKSIVVSAKGSFDEDFYTLDILGSVNMYEK